MRPGDIVRFKDVSSFANIGRGSFHKHDGKVGIVLELKLGTVSNGGVRVKVAMRDSIDIWSPKYFEVISEGG